MKREREKHITRLHIILFCLFLIAGITTFIVIKSKLDNSKTVYKDYEKEIVAAVETYYNVNQIELEEGYSKTVKIKKLYDESFIFNEDIIKKCKGYGEITNEGSFSSDEDDITFYAYIKCGNKYMTSGYQDY